MEQTEKWLNNYARNEIRFIEADFGERNRHILVQCLPCWKIDIELSAPGNKRKK